MVSCDEIRFFGDGEKNSKLEFWESFLIFCVLSRYVEEKLNYGNLASTNTVGESL